MMELQFPSVVPQATKLATYGQYPPPPQQQYLVPPPAEATTVLRLRGLPFEAKESDVRAFFGAFSLLHVHLCRRNGKTNGEAYVQLMSEEQAQQALMTLDRTSMGRRYIELFAAKEIELKKRRAQESQIIGSVLRMRGLPFTATPQDIVNFFEGIQISQGRDSILLTVNANQKPSGEAFVEFPDEATRNEALSRDRKMIGHRYIELFTASKEDVDKALSQQRFIMRQGLQFVGEQLALPQMMPLNMGGHFIPGQELSAGLDISDFLRGLSLGGSQRPAINGYASQAMEFPGAPIGGVPFVSQPLSPKLDGRYMPQGGFVGMDAPAWGQEGVMQPVCSFPPISSAAMDTVAASKQHDTMFVQQTAFPPSSTQQMMCMQGMAMTPTDVNNGGSGGLYHPWSSGMETPMFPTFVDHYDSTNSASSGFGCKDFYDGISTTTNMQPPLPDYLCINEQARVPAFPVHY